MYIVIVLLLFIFIYLYECPQIKKIMEHFTYMPQTPGNNLLPNLNHNNYKFLSISEDNYPPSSYKIIYDDDLNYKNNNIIDIASNISLNKYDELFKHKQFQNKKIKQLNTDKSYIGYHGYIMDDTNELIPRTIENIDENTEIKSDSYLPNNPNSLSLKYYNPLYLENKIINDIPFDSFKYYKHINDKSLYKFKENPYSVPSILCRHVKQSDCPQGTKLTTNQIDLDNIVSIFNKSLCCENIDFYKGLLR